MLQEPDALQTQDARSTQAQSQNLLRAEQQPKESVRRANRPRNRCAELTAACIFTLIAAGVTTWIIVACMIPVLGDKDVAWWYNVILCVLAFFACLVSAYVFQIGWGAYRWTRFYRDTKDTDWYKKWEEKRREGAASSSTEAGVPSDVLEWSEVQHVVVVTAYKEPIEMLQSLAYTLMSQRAYGICEKQITLVFALEEREGVEAKRKFQRLKEELHPFFKNILVTYHPPDLPGDIKGKASNFKWAVKKVEEYIRSPEAQSAGMLEHMCIIHVADADSLYDPNYFPNVNYHFCVDPRRYEYVWQPCMIPTCNYWELAAPCRQVNTMIAAQEMMSAYDRLEFQVPFSTYGYSLCTLQQIGGTGNAADAQDGDVIAEDHHLFIKGFFALEGRLQVFPIFLPCLNFAVGGETQSFCKNLSDRYVQAKRHMFGISELFFLYVLVLRGGWFGRSSRFGCRGYIRMFNLVYKLTKVHSMAYLGLWVFLGVVLSGLLKLTKAVCDHEQDDPSAKPHEICKSGISDVLSYMLGPWIFTVCSAGTFLGGVLVLIAFVRMLRATQHTLVNIANPAGSFMGSEIFEGNTTSQQYLLEDGAAEMPVGPSTSRNSERRNSLNRRRPIAVGAGFPWFGTGLQLIVEFIVIGFISSFILGTIPAIQALCIFICRGHRLEYVTAPKPGSVPARVAPVTSTPDAQSAPSQA